MVMSTFEYHEIRGEHGTVEVVDFKSEKKPDMEKDRDRLRQYRMLM